MIRRGEVDPSPFYGRIQKSTTDTPMKITLDLTPTQLVMLQDAVSYRYHQLESVVNNQEIYPDQSPDNPIRVTALRDIHILLDQY